MAQGPIKACPHGGGAVRAGLEGAKLASALDAAERHCRALGQSMTAPRRRVLELLLKSGKPLKPYDILAKAGENGRAAKPPTVYRSLDFLSKLGFAHRVESLSAYIACQLNQEKHIPAFLICMCCRDVLEIAESAPDILVSKARYENYTLSDYVFEAQGYCATCGNPALGSRPHD
jgi:Fur family zinc uptake transcriptional regulator